MSSSSEKVTEDYEKSSQNGHAVGQQSLDAPQDPGKSQAILKACQERNFQQLVHYADSNGGLLDDSLRKEAWPILLGCSGGGQSNDITEKPSSSKLPPRLDEEQVQKDVDRAFAYHPDRETKPEMDSRKASLYHLIIQVLRSHPLLCYFQGYHDIAQVLLLVLGPDKASEAVTRISLLRIRDYMLPELAPAIKHLELIPSILMAVDKDLADHLSRTKPFFALSATLTLYAHDIQEYSDIARLYDFLLAHEPVMAIYLFAAIIISRRAELLQIGVDEPEMLHFMLSKLPQPLNLEGLIQRALLLFKQHPPETLPGFAWWRVSSLSVLKTSRNVEQLKDMKTAEDLLRRQTSQLQRDELRRRSLVFFLQHRSTIIALSGAVFVGVVAYWLRRSENDRPLWILISRHLEHYGWRA